MALKKGNHALIKDLGYVCPEWFDTFDDNDTKTAIQEALDYGVNEVRFQAKTYILKSNININKSVNIVGNNTIFTIDTSTSTPSKNCWYVKTNDVQIRGCEFNRGGILFHNNSISNVIVKNNTFKRSIHNVQFLASDRTLKDVVIQKNKFFNQIQHAEAYSVISFMGTNVNYENVLVEDNHIQYTHSFGIHFYGTNHTYKNVKIKGNYIADTCTERTNGTNWSGSGGIYSAANTTKGVFVVGNRCERINEVGIEGNFEEIRNNTIVDTGCDNLNKPIGDNAGIYSPSTFIVDNTIINPGGSGGIKYFSATPLPNQRITNNKIINNLADEWKALTTYKVGDVVCNITSKRWYVCKVGGTSGNTAPSTSTATITDGTVVWDYKKMMCEKAIDLNVGKYDTLTITQNIFEDLPEGLYVSPATNMYLENLITRNKTISHRLASTNTICEIFDITSPSQKIRIETDFLKWDSATLPSGFKTGGTHIIQVNSDSDTTRKIPKITNTNTTYGSFLATNIFPISKHATFVLQIRYKTNNGLHIRFIDNSGWKWNLTDTDTTETWKERYFVFSADAGTTINKFEIFNANKTMSDGSHYVTIDYMKITEYSA